MGLTTRMLQARSGGVFGRDIWRYPCAADGRSLLIRGRVADSGVAGGRLADGRRRGQLAVVVARLSAGGGRLGGPRRRRRQVARASQGGSPLRGRLPSRVSPAR